jgi:hypothetical protein
MLDRSDDIPDLLTLTPDEAVALLRRLLPAQPAATVFAVSIALPLPAPQPSVASSKPTPTVGARVESLEGLERLMHPVYSRLPKLVTFYLVGRAYRGGATSLHAVAEEFKRRRKILPPGVTLHTGDLSDLLTELEDEVFALYFGKPGIALRYFPAGEGRGCVMSGDGWRAWETTRELLARNGWLPDW